LITRHLSAINVQAAEQEFSEAIQASLRDGSFVRLSLGKPRTRDGIQKSISTMVEVRGESRIKLVETFPKKDSTRILERGEFERAVAEKLGMEFRSGRLFTTAFDLTIIDNRRGEMRLHRDKPTYAATTPSEHNRTKQYLVSPDRPYLIHLGIVDRDHRIKPTMASKFKQIQRFIEILDDLLREVGMIGGSAIEQGNTPIRIVDIGSGKGYLTFALHDFLMSLVGERVETLGIERRLDLVNLCNRIAAESDLSNLRFEAGSAATSGLGSINVVIALHACDTATDDAIYQGVENQSELIVCAPCCQHELAPQIQTNSPGTASMLRFGLFKQRQADLVTDAARTLLLQVMGYKVKVVEFIDSEHTNKNLMLAAVKSSAVDRIKSWNEYLDLKLTFGFRHFTLEERLAERLGTFRAPLNG
jgi:hypothetical protein